MVLEPLLSVLLPDTCPACDGLAGVSGSRLCARCEACVPLLPRAVAHPPPLAAAFVLGPYAGPLGGLVRRGKYRPDPGAILELGRRLAAAAHGRLPSVSCATHVPVPPSRRLTRGFDQSALLAAEVARRLQVPHLGLLRRVRSEEQAGRSHRERIQGARGAFRLRSDVAPPPTVLLVDDVMTTGATAAACADELLAGGAECVILLAVAGGAV